MSRLLPSVVSALLSAQAMHSGLSAQSAPSPKLVHASLAGDWSGTLRYRDYRDSTRFVSLPTLLTGTTAPDSTSVGLSFTYDDGPGKTVRSKDLFALDATGGVLSWGAADGKRAPSRFMVQSLRGGKSLTLLVEMDGEDDDRKARIRETISVQNGELQILKEVRFADDAPWVFRHEYKLKRPE